MRHAFGVALLRSARSRLRGEGGFTILEMVVSMGVIFLSLVSLAYTTTIGFKDIALARQRDSANGIANELIEQVRALPFDTVKRGLANSDLSGDPAIVASGCPNGAAYCYRATESGTLEEIPRGNNAAVVPLVPHRGTVKVGPTTYTRAVYVTYYENDRTSDTFRVTATVSWTDPARRGVASTVQAQTILFSPQGCRSTATHPFAAPCQPFFYGVTQAADGKVSIGGQIGGVNLTSATLWTPAQSSNMQIEQISSVQGAASTAGIAMSLGGAAETTAGRSAVASAADNDPSQQASEYSTSSTSGTSQSLNASGSGNSLTLSLGGSNSASTTSTTAASTANACNAQTDGQPCGISGATQGASLSAAVGLNTGFISLGSANLVSVATHTTTGTTDRAAGTTGDGRLVAAASRSIGDTRIGGLPAGLGTLLVPLGWQGYLVRLNGFTDSVSAESGVNTSAPSVAASGTVSVWNGLGYTNVAIAPGAVANIPVASVVVQDPLSPGGHLRIALSAKVRTGGTATSSTSKTCAPTTCPDTRTTSSASSRSPIVVDLALGVSHAGNVIADVDVRVDLGTLEANATYAEAPSA